MLAMSTFVSPQILLVSLLAGWLNQEQQKVLEYLQEENRVLKAQLGQRLRLSDEQRRRLAAKGKELGRKLLAEVHFKVWERCCPGGLIDAFDDSLEPPSVGESRTSGPGVSSRRCRESRCGDRW